MCHHVSPCPEATSEARDLAAVVSSHPEQGWNLLCNGVVLFDDDGELLPDGSAVPDHHVWLPPSSRPDPPEVMCGYALQFGAVGGPPVPIQGRQVVPRPAQAGDAVDELAHDVGVPDVPVGLGEDVHEHPVQGDPARLRPPPRNLAGRVQRQLGDGRVRVLPGPPVDANFLPNTRPWRTSPWPCRPGPPPTASPRPRDGRRWPRSTPAPRRPGASPVRAGWCRSPSSAAGRRTPTGPSSFHSSASRPCLEVALQVGLGTGVRHGGTLPVPTLPCRVLP